MIIRRAVPSDASTIAVIYNQGIAARSATFETEPRTAEDRLRVIEAQSDRYPILVAERGADIIGWASLSEHSARACYRGIAECSVYVHDDHHGLGAGKLLMTALIAEARRLGYWKLVSRAFLFNEPSRAMCRRAGFREVGVYERHAQLDGVWLDVVIVERLIPENQP
ncbi:MAG: arsinothricin resistance N-acetyltransferase ArsN1 family A [bacterium]